MGANFGWDYPPGVTGRERAIAGPDEGEISVQCDTDATFSCHTVFTSEIISVLGQKIQHNDDAEIAVWARALYRALNEDTFEVEGHCNFEGKVDAEFDSGMIYWECPQCGTPHEDEQEEPEYD